ncbi:hypothetical protein GALMADRAFT_411141 [Galerina marginata CBS 339.88]|uniref:Uncharacterized protein n=1 Tax=Galerina marginata (strain CBS 339.88) TaxID=685588 RepID=A0A067T3H4_GALM3|nr:hypothetical protein GALMADRAFT_411141 [Galerina marginata CBS 339.88]
MWFRPQNLIAHGRKQKRPPAFDLNPITNITSPRPHPTPPSTPPNLSMLLLEKLLHRRAWCLNQPRR